MSKGFTHFVKNAKKSVAQLPDTNFYQMINQALLEIYLTDKKVRKQKEVQGMAKQLSVWVAVRPSFSF
jgi:tetraprenyl-beta-curcumene synthase